jgi:tagatose-6-phosphate ketose/aldose isomerase
MSDLNDYLATRIGIEAWNTLFELSELAKPEGERPDTVVEIRQQPWVWRESASLAAEHYPTLREWLAGVDSIYMTGAGSSVLLAQGLDLTLGGKLGKPCVAVPTTDLILDSDAYLPFGEKGLLVSFSRSGASPESFEAIAAVRKSHPGFKHLLITCNPDGELIQRFSGDSDFHAIALHPATCDKSLAMTSSFTSMLICGQMLGFQDGPSSYLEHVRQLSEVGERVLDNGAKLALSLTEKGTPTRVCLIGSKVLIGAAREGALKVMEMTDGTVVTLAETFMGVRHGPMSFLNNETVVVFFVSSDPKARRYELDLIRSAHAKNLGVRRIAVGYNLEGEVAELVDDLVELSSQDERVIEDGFRPPLDVMVAQLLALRLSLALGLDPDNPSPRGVISRVVEGVKIYGEEE